jgi:hypothetical protein
MSAITIAAALVPAPSVRADQPDKYTKPHEPFTAYGMQVRVSVVNPIDKSGRVQPTVFQEIAPCRLSSTLVPDRYDQPWGGPEYAANQARFYPSRGELSTATFVNPCSEVVPRTAIGIVARFTVTASSGDGEVHVDPWDPESSNATTVLTFKKGEVLMFEAGVMLSANGSFGVATRNAAADLMIDVLGYLLPDLAPAGLKGDTGATGAKGDKGDQGLTGATGAKGDTGATGAKGDKGDQGLTGATGAKGDTGATGEKGDKGDTGATGAKGDKGDQGLTGATGDKGDTGATGAKGDKGDQGLTGANGAKGDTGATGAKGDKGDAGPQGSIGPMGPMGPEGPTGPKGSKGDPGSLTAVKGRGCYPPGNNAESLVTVNDAAVSSSSIVFLNYTDAGSNGNALAIVSQGNGSFQTTGSPNKCFQYVILNSAPQQ